MNDLIALSISQVIPSLSFSDRKKQNIVNNNTRLLYPFEDVARGGAQFFVRELAQLSVLARAAVVEALTRPVL